MALAASAPAPARECCRFEDGPLWTSGRTALSSERVDAVDGEVPKALAFGATEGVDQAESLLLSRLVMLLDPIRIGVYVGPKLSAGKGLARETEARGS